MQALNNRKLLLGILTILLIARFVLAPLFEWQEQQIQEISAKATRLNKANNVIARSTELIATLEKIKQLNNEQLNIYYQEPSLNKLKLQLQQHIESLFKQHDVKLKNFKWAAEIVGDITQERASVTFEGKTKDFAKLQLTLAKSPKLLNIVQWTFYIKKMKTNSLGQASGSILLTAYNIAPSAEVAND